MVIVVLISIIFYIQRWYALVLNSRHAAVLSEHGLLDLFARDNSDFLLSSKPQLHTLSKEDIFLNALQDSILIRAYIYLY